jgi:hypothetical protein
VAVEAVEIDVFGSIVPEEISPIPPEETNPADGGYSIKKKVTLTGSNITNGYCNLATPAIGEAGEKNFVRLIPDGALEQEYGEDYTAMNNDANTNLVIIWKGSGDVTGITTPVYPTSPITLFETNDIIRVLYR